MKLDEKVYLLLNNFFKKIIIIMGYLDSSSSYSEKEYNWGKKKMALYTPYIDLKDKTVLDAGCGLGGKTVLYAESDCKTIIGIDMDENHINCAKEFTFEKGPLNTDFITGNLSNMPFKSNSFDIIFLNDVVEHIRGPILINALSECKRVVKVNGKICLEFPPWTSPFAAHMNIIIPWCHLFLSEEALINLNQRTKPKPRLGKLSNIEHFLELNRITIKEFKDIIRNLDFKVIYYEDVMLKNIKILNHIPIYDKYLTSRVVAVLSK